MPDDSLQPVAGVCVIGSYVKALVITADRLPVAGETLVGRDYRQRFGGKGLDVAVQAARLGARVTYVGVVGDDLFGHELIALMTEEDVDIRGLRVAAERPTGVGFVVEDGAGANMIVVDMGANELFSRADIDRAERFIDGCDVALAQLEIPLDTALYGLAAARRAGARTILNPSPATDLRGLDLSAIDVITTNRAEARAILGHAPGSEIGDAGIARELLGLGAGAVVVTRGVEGASVFEPAADGSVPAQPTAVTAFSIDPIDSGGAGDAFHAGLAVGLAEGLELTAAAIFAGAVAALCCEHEEAVPSYPRRAAVDAFLRSDGTGGR